MVDCDRVTIEQAARGDAKAFRRVYDHYAPFVWRIVYRTSGNDHETAREIVQETFVRIHRSLKSFKGASSLGTWIYRIAFNAAQSHLAKLARYRETTEPLSPNEPDPRFPADSFEAREMVRKVLEGLSAEDRFCLVAKEIDGMTFEEIASASGKSPESLRTRMSRMKEKIRAFVNSTSLPKEAEA
ncbi:MAG: RNA polymerase sigma factor [Chitinispirillaceae bacterium]|nr:RNA polymerase sigma factor [Chitinispirillaceae bacterium]